MSIIEIRAGGRFKLKQKIGSGSFGDIYLAQNVQTNEEFAVKLENSRTKYPQLLYEAKILHTLQGGVGIPNLMWCGLEGDFNILIMELLGNDIESLLDLCNRKLSLKALLMLVDQLISVIEYIHAKGFLHRDLKPENLLMGFGKNSHLVHIIDYGLSKRYRDPKTGEHIPFRDGKYLTGTARYASISTHQGKEQGRRDDLEALGYIFVYLFKGSLPWQGMQAASKQGKYEAIMQKKVETSLDSLCAGMPVEFKRFIEYSRRLKFEEKPDYHFIKRTFKELFIREGFDYDYVFDWILIPLGNRFNTDKDKVTVELNFSADDEIINHNLYNIRDYQMKNKTANNPKGVGGKDDKQNNDDNFDDYSNGMEKHPEKKLAGQEYLRTELKSAENRKGAPPISVNTPGKPSPMATAPRPTTNSAQQNNNANKKNNKDCNIF